MINNKKSNITFIIFTYNEEQRIEYPVKCFLPYGEVLVFDNYSTDKTREIAKKLGATSILIDKKNVIFDETEKVVNFVFKHVKTDWVFWGFADDMAPKSCLDLYKKISTENKYKAVVQKRKTLMYDGKSELHSGPISMKFFRKDSIDFKNNTLHQMGKFKAHVKPREVLYLPPIDEYATYHFSKDTTFNLMTKIDSQTTLLAKTTAEPLSVTSFILGPLSTFFETYIVSGTFRYGIKGIISAMTFTFRSFIYAAKKYEVDNRITSESIEKSFKKEKEKLLKKSPRTNFLLKIWAYFFMSILSRIHLLYKFKQLKKRII